MEVGEAGVKDLGAVQPDPRPVRLARNDEILSMTGNAGKAGYPHEIRPAELAWAKIKARTNVSKVFDGMAEKELVSRSAILVPRKRTRRS
jgi:hypothetical protein